MTRDVPNFLIRMKPICPYRNWQCFVLLKRTGLLTLIALRLAFFSYGQTSNISGIVNTYHRVVEILPSKSCVRVADPTGLNVNTLVMLVQMKGATINTTASSSSFGDTLALNGAGNYEIGTICYIIGDSIFLFHDLLNSYDVSSSVQLVQFAEYYSANIVDTVKALSWDNATGLGGVIAIFADQDITLNAPVYADSSGYGGGAYYNNTATCSWLQQVGTDYAYDITSTSQNNGAYKGEGVANVSSTQNSAKGAPANGGGGGNNHNNSGGGGANITAGGNGGGNSSGAPLGCATLGNYGRAGKALNSMGGTKIFMGGGAGAGHANNGSATTNFGGNGGGINFIWANNVTSNGFSISARGGKGGNSFGDGAGGGGAGGTIILHVSNYTDNVFVNAMGGNGGDSFNDPSQARCFGGGGGGSGGVVYFTGSYPAGTTSVNGGSGGAEPTRNAGCSATPVPGAAGSNGLTFDNYNFSRSTSPAGYCQLLLPSKLLFFNARKENRGVILNWQTDHPELVHDFVVEKKYGNGDWTALPPVSATDNKVRYATTDQTPSTGINFYRLKVQDKDGSSYYSEIRQVVFTSSGGDFRIFPNPSAGMVTVTGNFNNTGLLQVTDISGRIVWQQPVVSNTARIELPRFPTGMYLVRYREIVKKLLVK